MATSLEWLLARAADGLHVFPIQKNGKRPFGGSRGLDDATTEPQRIREWFAQYPGCNWAVNCGASNLAVLDVDCKNGAQGFESLAALELEHGSLPSTYSTLTPSGGRHYFFSGLIPSSASKLGKGLDTRGAGGYVLLPGSELDGVPYVAQADAEIAPAPAWLVKRLGEVKPKVEREESDPIVPGVLLDSPDNVTRATELLMGAAPANEGEGGDARTLLVAMQVKDCGVSEPVAADLMMRFWNNRCSPPWDAEDLERKVANAYQYGENPIGSQAAPPPGFQPIAPAAEAPLAVLASTFDALTLPPRPWVLGHQLIEGFVTATVAKGGVGKSTLALAEALAVATGKDLTGDKVIRPGAVWIYNTEDPMDELSRRVLAAAQHFKLTSSDLSRVHVSSGRSRPLIVARTEMRIPQLCLNAINMVITYIKEHQIKLWCVDPFVHTHYCDENSNAEIAVVMLAFSRIAEETGCAISLVHHATKGAGGEGEMDKARGASAFGGAVRIMRTVSGMAAEDCSKYALDPAQRKWYMRLDDAKGNMSPPAEDVRWFKRVDILLPNGDHVGTVEPVQLHTVEVEDLTGVRDAVIRHADRLVGHPHTAEEVIGGLIDWEAAIVKNVRKTTLARQIKDSFTGAPVYAPGVGNIQGGEDREGRWSLWVTAIDWLA